MAGEIVSVEFGMELVDEETGASAQLEMGEKGPLNSSENFCRILEQDARITGAICYNELAYRRWVRGQLPWEPEPVDRPWTDADEAWLRRWIWRNYRIKGKEELGDAVTIAESLKRINPIREFLDDLVWDGKSRIDTILPDYVGAEMSEYTSAVMRVFLFGAVARVYRPGIKFDYCMILAGPQGVGKSTFLSRLAIEPSWYNDGLKTLDADGDKIARQLSGRWIIELGELAAMKRTAEIESVKQFITAQFDVYKIPYAKYEEQRPRVCVFAGTTNSASFLVDKTGGRRFLPIEVSVRQPTKSLFAEDWRYEFEQLWAEAVHYFKKGEYSLTLSKEMEAEAEEHRGAYEEEDLRVGMLQEYLDNTDKTLVCVPQLYQDALNEFGKPTLKVSNELHEIMKHKITGWKLHPNKHGKTRCGKFGKQICYVPDGVDKLTPASDEPIELL